MIVLDILSWIFIVLGGFFSIVGGIGIVRLPEFYSRLHGGGVTDTMGAALIVLGLLFQVGHVPSGGILVAAKLVMILLFLIATSPSSCHALANSALTQKLEPQLDRPPKTSKKDRSRS